MLDQLDPGAAGGNGEGPAKVAVLDLVVARAPYRGGDAGFQMRFAMARLGRGKPMQIEARPFWNS
jgi:hypothetical protein